MATGLLISFLLHFTEFSLSGPHRSDKVKANLDANVMEGGGPSKGCDMEFKELYQKVRVLCWVMTQPAHHQTKAKQVKATWGKRCNKLIFVSSVEDPSLPSIQGTKTESYIRLWEKTKNAFKYVYKHHYNDADWFLKVDDDTYVIVENMRLMLEPYNTSSPIFFGFKIRNRVTQGFMSGGGGYVLSKEALRRFVEVGLPNRKFCRKGYEGYEDVEMAMCLAKIGVMAGDSRDSMGKHRFLLLPPGNFIIPRTMEPKFQDWVWRLSYYPLKEGMKCCSNFPITFHYIDPDQMLIFHYLIYHVRPYCVHSPFPGNKPPDESVIPPDAFQGFQRTN